MKKVKNETGCLGRYDSLDEKINFTKKWQFMKTNILILESKLLFISTFDMQG